MRAVIQKVKFAKVRVDDIIISEISTGLLVLLAVAENDDFSVIKWIANKIINLRIFPDSDDRMNKSVLDINGEIMIISNFTVYGDVHKGFRPNFMKSASADISKPMYLQLVNYLKDIFPNKVADGIFGAMMDIELVNDGPVTVIIEKEKGND
ncbi:D-tyrosyl-tRNA(Tyr) deacylase [Bacteroidetes/Chlorobi group bacterium ChocPot_Mid]|jgi:D-tyrosyl-tRNA(Tyr) deacylase|nr:MAG: D-tyrosyl-tRNA(Tyr) deacylase [Bacteroidetes/Chlorobi group bacterium ChocPot_Mid]